MIQPKQVREQNNFLKRNLNSTANYEAERELPEDKFKVSLKNNEDLKNSSKMMFQSKQDREQNNFLKRKLNSTANYEAERELPEDKLKASLKNSEDLKNSSKMIQPKQDREQNNFLILNSTANYEAERELKIN